MKRTFFDPECRARIVQRIRSLEPDSQRRWGKMTCPQMVAHLTDQMRHTLGDTPVRTKKSWLGVPPMPWLAIHVFPWPRGRVRGPRAAFVTQPVEWNADRTALEQLVERFGERKPGGKWSNHPLFGEMNGRAWGAFCYRHFDHHLTQFGV